ncbi:MAG: hypothetical protein EXS14_06445 [Planctomycetes bacterium]|nr:hypothetical protein [Planctomycetota bacterium]
MQRFAYRASVLATLMLLACIPSCSDEPTAPPATQAVVLDAPAALMRLTNFLQRPWKKEVRAHADFAAAHSVLLQEEAAGFADKARMAQLLSPPLPAVLHALEMLEPVGDRLQSLGHTLDACLTQLRVPDGQACPLRTRIEANWKRSREQAWKLVNDGLDALRQGQEPTRFRIGFAALNQARADAEPLTTDAVKLLSAVETVRGLSNALEQRLHFSKRRVALLRQEGDETAAATLESAVRAVESALDDFRKRAEDCAQAIACELPRSKERAQELREESDGLLAVLR